MKTQISRSLFKLPLRICDSTNLFLSSDVLWSSFLMDRTLRRNQTANGRKTYIRNAHENVISKFRINPYQKHINYIPLIVLVHKICSLFYKLCCRRAVISNVLNQSFLLNSFTIKSYIYLRKLCFWLSPYINHKITVFISYII